MNEQSNVERSRAHIPVDGGPDRAVYINGKKAEPYDGGHEHVIVSRTIDGTEFRVTVGLDGGLSAGVEAYDFPALDPSEECDLEPHGTDPRPKFRGECAGEELLVEIVEVGDRV